MGEVHGSSCIRRSRSRSMIRALLLDIGGAEANLSIALSRMGRSARFISHVGDDPFGQRMRSTLANEGVDVDYLTTDTSAPTGVFFREWLPDGARRVYYYRANSAASRIGPDDLRAEMFAGARVVHLTGITPVLSASCAAACARAIELAHEAGALVSFDPNYRARLWKPEAARKALLPLMRQSGHHPDGPRGRGGGAPDRRRRGRRDAGGGGASAPS